MAAKLDDCVYTVEFWSSVSGLRYNERKRVLLAVGLKPPKLKGERRNAYDRAYYPSGFGSQDPQPGFDKWFERTRTKYCPAYCAGNFDPADFFRQYREEAEQRRREQEADSARRFKKLFEEFFASIKPTSEAEQLLDLVSPYTAKDVRYAWKLKAAAVHPDRGGNTEEFIRLTKARDILLGGLQ